jgi:hypothetical protein
MAQPPFLCLLAQRASTFSRCPPPSQVKRLHDDLRAMRRKKVDVEKERASREEKLADVELENSSAELELKVRVMCLHVLRQTPAWAWLA